ncbi:methyl-accepting chemotaxis protein [Curvibacter sp. APW13]|uniref:methyl-accepting chemotaxis protein n=1 Tax=Curvibacter sp. APW13 TaxID=3077236 RepID=UPI0028DEFF08|nr:methyl-accepting chemotaxis protein [Curvibacter sp. APW13]MDT8990843.1 methyl-accepting chemotaxis protein [Curvibacter sp. APW13]
MPFTLFTSLRNKVIALVGVVVLLGLLLQTGTNVWIGKRHALDALASQTGALARSHAESIGAWIAARQSVVRSFSSAATASDPVPMLAQAKIAGGVDTAYIGFPDKRIFFSEKQDLPADYDPTARPWYQQAAAAGGMVLTPPYVDASSKKLVITFANAVKDGNTLQAVAALDVFMDGISTNIASIRPTPSTFGFLVNKAGQIMVHEDVALVLKPATAVADGLGDVSALAGKGLVEMPVAGSARLLLVEPVKGTDWFLVIALHRDEALAGISALATNSLVSSVGIAVVAVILVGMLLTRLLARMMALRDAMQDIGSGHGDLSKRLSTQGNDELAAIAVGYNQFVEKMHEVLVQVRRSAESVAMASAEIAQGNNDLSARTEQQAAAIEETNASMSELGGTVNQNADAARQANQLATNASSVAVQGGEVVGRVVDTMKDINDSSRKIADIISVIDGIAFQTNILALNAAVEAARAGEQGRGFAVVASEVRALAGRSAEAAKEIKALITASVEKVEHGTTLVDQAGSTMTEVVASIQRVTDIMGEISAASNEQSLGVSQISEAIGSMDQTTQQNAALVEEMAAAASSLKSQAQELVQTVAVFKLAEGHQAPSKMQVRAPHSSAKPFAGTDRRGGGIPQGAAARAPAPAPKPAPKPAQIAAAKPAPAPKAAARGDDDWETF